MYHIIMNTGTPKPRFYGSIQPTLHPWGDPDISPCNRKWNLHSSKTQTDANYTYILYWVHSHLVLTCCESHNFFWNKSLYQQFYMNFFHKMEKARVWLTYQ